jgi:hypothetical protein
MSYSDSDFDIPAPPSTPVNGPPRGLGPVSVGYPGYTSRRADAPLQGVAKAMTALTFHDAMKLATEIVSHEGYKPPQTAHEMAAILNAWAIAERDRG